MLSVAKLSRGREGYYLATVASGRDEPGGLIEPDGRWLGRAAGSLGLSGTVDGTALRAVLAGVDPATGELLSARHDRVRVAAYDCTYSTPKSVSLLHALGPEEVRAEVRAGHEEAAAAALSYLERRGARVRRSLQRGEAASSVPAGGFVAAAFLHRTSRAPDPHLHSHVLVANLAPGPDGRWSALDGRGLYLELAAARDLYETQLRSELTSRLSVSWRELQGAWADLAGIDPKVSRAFSRRSAEIEEALGRAGRSSPRARWIASAKTRPEKDLETPYETLVEAWRERSYRLGVSDARLAAVTGRTLGELPEGGNAQLLNAHRAEGREPLEVAALEEWASRELGEQGALSRDGTCRRSDLVRSRCASLRAGATVEQVERDVDAIVTEGRVVAVAQRAGATSPMLRAISGRLIPGGVEDALFTTPEILAVHERLTRLVQANRGRVELCSYDPGGRLDALDRLSSIASDEPTRIFAVAPGRAAAASFEAATGIETAPVAEMIRMQAALGEPREKGGVLVMAEAHRLGPWELSSGIGARLAAGGRVILFAPAASLTARFGTLAAIAPELSVLASSEQSLVPRATVASTVASERHRFAGQEVLVVPDAPSARSALLETWKDDTSLGRRSLIVASDDSIVRSLRESVRKADGSPDDVVEARNLAERLARPLPSEEKRRIVVLGPLPGRVASAQGAEPVYVTIAPFHSGRGERLGRAAEVAQPRYLVAELGKVSSDPAIRGAWRAAAADIEDFRRRCSIDDPLRATGDSAKLVSAGLDTFADAAAMKLRIRQAFRAPGLGRHPAERSTQTRGLSR